MRRVFADTHYWIAIIVADDPWRRLAFEARRRLGRVQLVTTDAILTEFLGAVGKSAFSRTMATTFVKEMLSAAGVDIIPDSRELFLEALDLYASKPDKTYSLVDCISMCLMRSLDINDVLTNDHHFAQEGFNVLIRLKS